jgi:AraC-like DNA-binding protein
MEITRRESAGGWMEAAVRDPHPALRPYAGPYWGFVERTPRPMRRRELPDGRVVLILGLGPEMRQLDGRDVSRTLWSHSAFVAGVDDTSAITEHDGVSYGVEVALDPIAATMVLGVPMDTLARRVVAVEDLLGRPGLELLERLQDAPGWAERFDVLDAELARRLANAVPPSRAVAWAWRRVVATEGRVEISRLADELGWSRKHLSARFRREIGLPPKVMARVLRFQRAVRLLEHGNGDPLGEIALDCGYYDQAHFNRDFREFAGSTPTEFLGRRLVDGFGLAAE